MFTVVVTITRQVFVSIIMTNSNIVDRLIGCTKDQAYSIYYGGYGSGDGGYIVPQCYLDPYSDDYYLDSTRIIIFPALNVAYLGLLIVIWHKKQS